MLKQEGFPILEMAPMFVDHWMELEELVMTAACLCHSAIYHSSLSQHFSLKSVDRKDSGKYWCQVETNGKKEESQQVWLIVEGKGPVTGSCPRQAC